MVDRIKKIEAAAYPQHMQMLQDCSTLSDVAEYCECSVRHLHVLQEGNWYILIGEHKTFVEVVDWASANGMANPIKAFSFVKKVAGNKAIRLDARESTSYPFIKVMEKVGKIKIKYDSPWNWDGEVMHEMEVIIL